MPVEEDIDLNTISEEELEKLIQQAEKMEAAAEKASRAKTKIQGLVAGVSPLGMGTGGVGGIFGGDDVIGKGKAIPIPKGDLAKGVAPYQRENIINKILTHEQEIANMKKLQNQIISQASQGLGAFRDPLGFLQNNILGQLGKFALPVGAAIGIATTIIAVVKEMFGPGGLFDVRKLVKDEVSEYFELNIINAINRGELFLGNTAEIRSGAPTGPASTSRASYGHLNNILKRMGN